MKKYIIITALSLCNTSWSIDHTTKKVTAYINPTDHLNTLCNNSGWCTTVNNIQSQPLKKPEQWEPALNAIMNTRNKTHMNNKDFRLRTFFRYILPKDPTNSSNLFLI